MSCSNNLKQIGLALHSYHDFYGSFPPAYVADEEGNPMHSWRVLLLPWLDGQAIYDKYDFAEPWNGPNNSQLLKYMPQCYTCPATPRGSARGSTTSYLAVVGPTTAWPGQSTCKLSEILDGISNTILVTEVGSRNVPWLEPLDLELTEALDILVEGEPIAACNDHREDFFYKYKGGRNVAFADGSIRHVPHGIGRTVWSALLEKSDDVVWDDDDLNRTAVIVKRLRVDNCLRLAVLCVLFLFPIPWVWLNPTSGTG